MQPGQFNPKGEDWIGREFAALRQEIRELKAANVFGLTGITPKDGGTEFDGYVNVNGPMSITGTLNLPAGIIGNDALASPITIAQASNSEIFFPITTENTPRAMTTVEVPEGFSQAYVFAVCNVGALSTMIAGDRIFSSTTIQGVASREVKAGGGQDGGSVGVTTAKSSVLTGLNGGTISVGVTVRGDTPRIASSDNRAYVETQVIFLR